MSDEIKIENIRKSNKGLIISIVAVLVLALIAVLVLFMPKSADAKKISEQLSLSDKYLSELQYEQAEAAYLAVIEIDPKNVDAYLGLADVYIAQGEYDKAAEVLEDALEELEGENAEEVKGKLDEVEQVRQAAEVTRTPEPTATSTLTQTVMSTPTPVPTNDKYDGITSTFRWKVKEDGTIVIAELLDKNLTYVEIPAEIDGKVVTEIGEFAFNNCENLRKILLPEQVLNIGTGAFTHCHNLQEVILPTGITEIKDETFRCCYGLIKVSLPDSVTKIGKNAFTFCESMESISIPDSVFIIENEAFNYCKMLKEIRLSNQLEKIGERAFYECVSLQSVSLPNSLTTLGECAFYECSNLEEITFSENLSNVGECVFMNTKWLSLNEEAEELVIVNGILYRGMDKERVVIPEGVTRISAYAFANCSNIKQVSFPDSLEKIDVHAFIFTEWEMQRNMIIAGKVVYHEGISTYGDVVIPDGIVSISDYAFHGQVCRVTSVYVPASVKEIGENCFHECKDLTIITPAGSYAEQFAMENNIPVVTQ